MGSETKRVREKERESVGGREGGREGESVRAYEEFLEDFDNSNRLIIDW